MKTFMTALLGLTLLVGPGAPAVGADDSVTISASEYDRLLQRQAHRRHHRYVQRWFERDADALAIGTTRWWRQMDRERRGGRRRR